MSYVWTWCQWSWWSLFRKRFENAEHEYVLAKINLHKATELKELLSEHLCAVVQENEVRKAKKLSELTAALRLGDDKTKSVVGAGDIHSEMFQRTPTPRSEIWPHNLSQEKSVSLGSRSSLSAVSKSDDPPIQQMNKKEKDKPSVGTSGSDEVDNVDATLVPGGAITLD